MSENPTAPWPWPRRDAITGRVDFNKDHLTFIRSLVVYWDTGETGAAHLVDGNFDTLEDAIEPDVVQALKLFMARAKVKAFEGLIVNHYKRCTDEIVMNDLLAHVPDKSIAELFRSGQDVPFNATSSDLLVWNAASLGPYGIDVKRPFGTGQVSRDLRALLDPDKKMATAAFTKLNKEMQSRMMLMLQFFVQNAELQFGKYVCDHNYNWMLESEMPTPGPEIIHEGEWSSRIDVEVFYKCKDYIDTMKVAAKLVSEDRLPFDYGALCKLLNLDHFRTTWHGKYRGSPLQFLDAALLHFPETSGEPSQSFFTLMKARILNAEARFEEAKAAMQKARVFGHLDEAPNFKNASTRELAFIESVIAAVGLGDVKGSVLDTILNGRNDDWGRSWPRNPRDWHSDLLEQPEVLEADDTTVLRLSEAAAWQLSAMQEPYVVKDED